jgi:hypothetical protein
MRIYTAAQAKQRYVAKQLQPSPPPEKPRLGLILAQRAAERSANSSAAPRTPPKAKAPPPASASSSVALALPSHGKKNPKKNQLPPQYQFDQDTLAALHLGDISGYKHNVQRFVVLPEVPDAPQAARFQATCRAFNTHKFAVVEAPGASQAARSSRTFQSTCEPGCKHAHVCMRCGAPGHPAAHCTAPTHLCNPSALERLGPLAALK